MGRPKVGCLTKVHCRSALARERGVPVTNPSPDTLPSRASALLQVEWPTPFARLTHAHCRSRLAAGRDRTNTVGQPLTMSTAQLPSPASQHLPALVIPKVGSLAEVHCRSALAREHGVPVTNPSPDTLPSRASALLQVECPTPFARLTHAYCMSRLAAGRDRTNILGQLTTAPLTHCLRQQASICRLWSFRR